MNNIFYNDPADGVSTIRLYTMRLVYLLNFLGLGWMAGKAIITHDGEWQAFMGVAFSFWAALALLMGVGVFQPLKMIPILMIQFVYKTIWSFGVFLPMWLNHQIDLSRSGMARIFIIVMVIDGLLIPWNYVFKNFGLSTKKV